ncbi:extracellular solute-binding protein [Cohnella lubricantis]|uniref:Extracellular solute-binding protein n=1 Tax=Cohnella lubricantis TaxID=2163172 RepID=A0A841TFK7_9BACL|nr:extracellular solute-binding protein [Cohnella lubricantis]MBB6678875.1 extracellular solute-binding protein [Cohnella lubricantis]MBP2120201.1 multiple sugar transport system substrate-binding protein [Cohnella lubricantis]
MLRKLCVSLLCFIVLILNGCMKDKGGALEEFDPNKKVTIKVMYWSQEAFDSEYGNLFFKYPNLKIEVVSNQKLLTNLTQDPQEMLLEYIEEYQPDILLLSPIEYERMALEGQLYPLEPVIKQDQFDLEGIHPGILNLLRGGGEHELFGLSPDFSSAALYYNANLFESLGIDPPTDAMSWEEVLQLANRVANADPNEKIYGLTVDQSYSFQSYFSLLSEMGSTENLSIFSPDYTTMELDSPSWFHLIEQVVEASRSGALYMPTESETSPPGSGDGLTTQSLEESLKQNKFMLGESAMIAGSSNFKTELSMGKELYGIEPINWNLVTVPVDPNHRNQSGDLSLGSIFSINAKSPNVSAAWELLKYINGEEYAKLKSETVISGRLLSRVDYNADVDGRSMKPFYKLDPKPPGTSSIGEIPIAFFETFPGMFNEEIAAAIDHRLDLQEAIRRIQTKGQELLDQAYLEAELAGQEG